MEILYWSLLILGGFLLGSIMFCELIPKIILGKDIYKISVDNNPGAFNAFKHCGIKIGIPCLILDVLKGFIPVILASLFMDFRCLGFAMVMVAPVLGHAIGLFNSFHGGKCIAVSFGVLLGILPITWVGIVVLTVLYILFTVLIKINPPSKRSVFVYGIFMAITCTFLGIINLPYIAVGCFLVALLPIIKFVFTKNRFAENKFNDIMDVNDEADDLCENTKKS